MRTSDETILGIWLDTASASAMVAKHNLLASTTLARSRSVSPALPHGQNRNLSGLGPPSMNTCLALDTVELGGLQAGYLPVLQRKAGRGNSRWQG